ncbi:hypothetical protein [Syntrophomonas palmitatica]|uniref:hypothetical protein n=1 Tax=Syntrophomonas palmitatica TaxID=402877 RepID=UPI0006D27836|nr:hypothetical protein [Syntrophomonas palmitatica]
MDNATTQITVKLLNNLFPQETLQATLGVVQENISKGRYAPLLPELSEMVRAYYREQLTLPESGGDINIYTPDGMLLATGYQRIVVGDYGAYIEISRQQIVKSNLRVKPGQEFRLNPDIANVKYEWYEPVDGSNVKIYFQIGTVKYADYQRGMYYISPQEVVCK